MAERRFVVLIIRAALLVACLSTQARASIPVGSRNAWMALLHYSRVDGKWSSSVEAPLFFLDVEGSRDPEREWDADRVAFLAAPDSLNLEQHAQCRFPARLELMKASLGWVDSDVPRVTCRDLENTRLRLHSTSLSVVFVSYFLGNPASAFGHTLLYLGNASDGNATLAAYSVSFEANTNGMSPAKFIPRGLAGGLVAGYRIAPLHERVRKYERDEQRDLWVFPLRVGQDEIDQLVRHLWELKDVTFKYGFFGGNCAQKVLEVVHAVAPSYQLLPYRASAVLPSEVGRRLIEKVGLAGQPIHRPSLVGQYSRRVSELTPTERRQLVDMVASRSVTEGVSPATLSAALLWSEFGTPDRAFRRAADTTDHADLVWKRNLWAARVAAGDDRSLAPSLHESGPTLTQAHLPSRITVRGGFRSDEGPVVSASARWLLHDAIDPGEAYPSGSTIEAGRVELGVSAKGNVFVDDATVLRIENLAPASNLQTAFAWTFDLGARRVAQRGDDPLHAGAEIGIGVGTALLGAESSAAAYAIMGVRPGMTLAGRQSKFLPLGVWTGGLLLRLPAKIRARVSAEYALSLRKFEDGAVSAKASLRKGITRQLDIELTGALSRYRSSATLGFVSFR